MSHLSRLLLAIVILIPSLALGLPILTFDDELPAGISTEQARRLKTQLSTGSKLWRLHKLQVSEIRSTGPTPDAVEGVVIWRSAFGIPVGRSSVVGGFSHFDISFALTWAAWSGTLLLEAAMLALATWSFIRTPEQELQVQRISGMSRGDDDDSV